MSQSKIKKNMFNRGRRDLKIHVKTSKGRTVSSTRWLNRQLNDEYVKRAKIDGFRGRAAYKLIELNEKFDLFFAGATVIDLGCAPGAWCQVAANSVNSNRILNQTVMGRVIGVDVQDTRPIKGVEFIQGDFLNEDTQAQIKNMLGGSVDLIISDMAANSTGHKSLDHLRVIALCEAAAFFSFDTLKEGGGFVAKVLAGGAEGNMQKILKQHFRYVANVKPAASRADSSEKYVVARGFRNSTIISNF